jgi:hypothetical protein
MRAAVPPPLLAAFGATATAAGARSFPDSAGKISLLVDQLPFTLSRHRCIQSCTIEPFRGDIVLCAFICLRMGDRTAVAF